MTKLNKNWRLVLRFCLACALLALGLSEPSGELLLAMPILIPLAITAAVTYGAYYVAAALVIGQYLYGQDQARKAKNRAKDAYNAALQDRMTTIQGGSAPWQIIYGETWVSPVMVAAVLTSGDKDQYKHVVYVWAAHECESILDFTLAGKSVSVGSTGHVNAGKWAGEGTDSDSELVTLSATGTVDLDRYPERLICLAEDKANPEILYRNDVVLTHLAGGEGGRITVKPEFVATWANRRVWVNYEVPQVATPTMRVRHHLGAADQVADAGLLTDCPADWKASDRGRGLCYSVVRYDLNEEEFQGGPLEARAKIRGRKVYDPRTATTAWTANAALCVADFIQAEWGKGAAAAQVDTAAVNAAANVCAEQIDYVVKFPDNHTETKQAPRFTINGVVRSDADPDQTLELMCQAMAGNAVRTGGMWSLQAGVYTPPVMDLSDADCLGSVESVPGLPGHEVINSLRGQFYDPLKYGELTDYPPYQNEALVAEDGGRSLWDSRSFPYSDEIWRCWQLARITVEQTRGEVLVFPAKRRALRLKPGQRVRVSLSKLGMVQQVFRVVKREWTVGKPVMLTLQQDDPSVWDMGDAAASLAPTSTRLVDPWVVAPVVGLSATSGSATLLKQGDGTVVARVKLSYNASADALVLSTGALQIEYRRQAETTWQRAPDAGGASTEAYVLGLEEKQLYVLRARWVNGMGARGDWASTTVLHVGKTAAPDPVQALAVGLVPGALRITWTPCPDVDYADTVLRVGASWAASTLLANVGPASTYDWLWPAQGSYKIWAVHLDSSGNQSTPVWVPATVDAAIYIGAGNITPDPAWLNNLVNLGWWKKGGAIPWGQNQEENILYSTGEIGSNIGGPKGGDDVVWYCREVAGDGENGGGWDAVNTLNLDPTKTYRFAVPIYKRDGAGGGAFWGPQSGSVCYNNSTAPHDNPYFAWTQRDNLLSDRWYLFVGFIYPQGSTGNTDASAGIWDCKTGQKFADGWNYCHAPGGARGHRAYQFYAGVGSTQLFGRPMVNLVDGTEPSLREYFAPDAVLNASQLWGQVAGRPRTYRVGAYGASATYSPVSSQLLNGETGAVLVGGGPMYRVATIHRSTFVVTDLGAFNTYSGGSGVPAAMAAALNSISRESNTVVVVWTYDEPQGNRVNDGLLEAMLRHGASRAVFGSARFRYRSAYILVGIAGCGEGNGAECYAGDFDADPNAWCDLSFQIMPTGALVVSGTTSGARALVDYGYVGHLAATKNQVYYQDSDPGAVDEDSIWVSSTRSWQRKGGAWRPYVGTGSVDTMQLALNAATAIIQDSNDFGAAPAPQIPEYVHRAINYTPTVDCIVNFSATIIATNVLPDSGNRLYWAVSVGGGADVVLASCSSSLSNRQTFAGISSFTAAAGVALVFKLLTSRPFGNPAQLLYESSIRIEVIKR